MESISDFHLIIHIMFGGRASFLFFLFFFSPFSFIFFSFHLFLLFWLRVVPPLQTWCPGKDVLWSSVLSVFSSSFPLFLPLYLPVASPVTWCMWLYLTAWYGLCHACNVGSRDLSLSVCFSRIIFIASSVLYSGDGCCSVGPPTRTARSWN